MRTYLLLSSAAATLAACAVTAAGADLTYVDLVHRLTDLEHLATIPPAGERCAQCSSFDRASRYDEASGKYLNWDANGDDAGIIRKEGDKLVLAEMTGPGCIWRIWSAAPKEGHVRIYLDGAAEPAVDLPFVGYFDHQNSPFTRGAIVHVTSSGWNNYTPIPYAKSCKVVADPGWGAYYHFTYSTFAAGTRVPAFTRSLGEAENAALDEANRLLAATGPGLIQTVGGTVLRAGSDGTNALVTSHLEGPVAITAIRFKAEIPSGVAAYDYLRSITLQIRWDGEESPSVWAPIGDFFGTAPGANPYHSLPLGLTEDGWWYCNWFMPFAKSADIRVHRDGVGEGKFEVQIGSHPLTGAAGYARFHAKWHRDFALPSEPERQIDWPFLKTAGAGRFVGVMLHVWNPRGGWWGEGDEKFFVDGEKFPSTFGTGSEDYFGYAWCNPALFQNAYHNQTHNDGNNKGHVSVNRWHVPDSVPFAKSFEGCIEKYYANQRPTLYAATTYWYLAPDGKDPYTPLPLDQRVGYWTTAENARVKGAIEGESLKVIRRTGGGTEEQDLSGFNGQWSNDAHLWWTGAHPGDKLELALPVVQSHNYRVALQLTKARDYGIVQLALDGEKLGGPIDLYNPDVVPTGELDLGTRQLAAGDHVLSVEILGANPKADKSYMFGLDYLKLTPADK